MPSEPKDLERELQIVEATAADLKNFLLSDSVYWQLAEPRGVRERFPQGTLGGMLFRLDVLDKQRGLLSASQQTRLDAARDKIAEALRRWGVQVEQKAAREITSRLRTWENFLDEAQDTPSRRSAEYAAQVGGRLVLEYLRPAAGSAFTSAQEQGIKSVDNRLGALAAKGDFVWSASLQTLFPEDRFPYMYVRLR
jgi:hypothetical protein